MAREIMKAPKGVMVDHKSGDRFDNRKENLRFATNQQNQHNQTRVRIDNTSGYKGVIRTARGFGAQIYMNRRRIWIGTYRTPEDAARAYDAWARELFGEFAHTNFPA
jgi:hypothetical protein